MPRMRLTDEQWFKLLLIMQEFKIYDKKSLRFTVEAILFRMRTGCPWRDLPAKFGNWGGIGAVAYIFIPQVSIIGGAITGGVLVAGSTLGISIQESQRKELANIVRNDIQNYRMGGELSDSLAQSLKQIQNVSDMSEADAIALIEKSSEQL